MSLRSQPEHETVHEKNVSVRMRDGTTLYANITRPAADGPFPALVERTPYDKEGASENNVGSPEFFARRGYAVAIQDVRGRFESEGEWYAFAKEAPDGYEYTQTTDYPAGAALKRKAQRARTAAPTAPRSARGAAGPSPPPRYPSPRS